MYMPVGSIKSSRQLESYLEEFTVYESHSNISKSDFFRMVLLFLTVLETSKERKE